jgi:hypothetical protein
MFGNSGSTPPNCNYYPTGPIVGLRSYLDPSGYFCGADLAYNTCSCTSALFSLSDYNLKIMNWAGGDPPVSLGWMISSSVSSGMSNYSVKSCGNFLLSPVTMNVNGYTQSPIVSDGSLASTFGDPSSITLTNPTINGTFNVLL